MRDRYISILLVSVLLLSTVGGAGIPIAVSPEIKVHSQQNVCNEDNAYSFSGNSFHGTTTGSNANWYVVKLSSSSPFHLEEINVSVGYFLQKHRRWAWGFLFTNLQGENYYFGGPWCLSDPEDRFIHINMGPINYTYNHLYYWEHGSDKEGGGWKKWCGIPITFESGEWYLICIAAPTITCHWSVWINTTEEVEFVGATEGNSSFIYGAEDFLGKLNNMGPWILITIAGEKRIKVNHTLIAYFYTLPGGGPIKFQYIDPKGDKKTSIVWDSAFLHLGVPLKWDFDPYSPTIGGSGDWIFRMGLFHYIYFGFPQIPPPIRDAGLWGADIKLP